eukprot:TRINITY_DN1418_c3_g1_i1.p1 TRINITY_DN1418_c3_g1~~TRINITY_DN1418_c3_g1_i1.p1  ORF type:complete len:428 (+),score=73.79 TRINITY_DN1418_c3_g1_i1:72-1355(+)
MGRVVGGYEVGKTLGKGTFSKVKLGTDIKTGAEVAVKVIHKERMAQEDLEEQVLREISVTKLLRHDNIVKVLEVFQTQKYLFLVMELVTGGMMYTKLLHAGRFREDESRKYFHQLVLGVKYCHNQGIAHRDLKLENLLLTEDDVIKISDFGLANLQPGTAEEGDALLRTVCGTPNYVAPEVINANHQGYNGMAADVWSSGILLYVMHAGMLPFDHSDIDVLFKLIESSDYQVPQWFSPEVCELISKMLTKSALHRISLDEVIQDPWFQVGFDVSKIEATKEPIIKDGLDTIDVVDDTDGSDYSHSPMGKDASQTKLLNSFEVQSRMKNAQTQQKTLMGSIIVDTTLSETFTKLSAVLAAMDAHPDRKESTHEIKGYTTRVRHGKMLAYTTICLPTASDNTLLEVKFVRGNTQDFDEFFFTLRSKMEL